MTKRRLGLFVLMCGVGGALTLAGSIAGASIRLGAGRNSGLFAGALVGGVVGVLLAAWIACRFGIIPHSSHGSTTVGGVVGFGVAAAIATSNLHMPIIPLLSETLVGFGAILGDLLAARAAERSR